MDESRVILTQYYVAERQSLVEEATRLLHGDSMTAEDIVQNTFLRLLSHLSSNSSTSQLVNPSTSNSSTCQLVNPSTIPALVHTIMFNQLRDLWRHRQHRQDYEHSVAINAGAAFADDVFSVCSARQISELLEYRMARMDKSVAQMLRMNILEEKSVSEIADELDIKYKTIENRLQAGRKQLRSYMRKAV